MLHDIHHVTVQVTDLERAIARYTAYGLVCHRHTSHSVWFFGATAALRVVLATQPYAAAPSWVDVGISHVCIQTPDSRAWLQNIATTDARPRSGPVDLGTGHWYTYIDDQDGITTECEGVPYAPELLEPWLAHVAFSTTDLARITRFYAALTSGAIHTGRLLADIPAVDSIAGQSGIRTQPAWVSGATMGLEFWHYQHPIPHPPSPPSPHRLGYHGITFVVADLSAAGERIATHGGRMCTDKATEAVWLDPDGNHITLWSTTHETLMNLPTRTDVTRQQRIAASRRP